MQATDEKTKTEDRAASQARAQLDCIIEMLTAYNKAEKHGEVTYEGYDYGEDSMRGYHRGRLECRGPVRLALSWK